MVGIIDTRSVEVSILIIAAGISIEWQQELFCYCVANNGIAWLQRQKEDDLIGPVYP